MNGSAVQARPTRRVKGQRNNTMRWKMRFRYGLLMFAGMVLSACAAQPTAYSPAAFAHRVATQDVELYWNCARAESGFLEFDGIARTIGGQDVRFLEMELDSVGPTDSRLQSATAALPDIVLHINQASPFHLQLPTRGDETRFDLFYHYSLPPRIGALVSTEERRYMVRDACSETQHRARLGDDWQNLHRSGV